MCQQSMENMIDFTKDNVIEVYDKVAMGYEKSMLDAGYINPHMA